MAIRLFLGLLGLTQLTVASNSLLYGSNNRNISEWFWQTSIAVGNYLYITAGEYYNLSGNNIYFQNVTSTMVIDLSTSWTNATVTATTFQHDPAQNARRPMLWYDNAAKKIYKYGGWPYYPGGNTYSQNLYSLTVDSNGKMTSNGWTGIAATGANGLTSTGRAPGGAAFTYTNTSFFSLGGVDPDTWISQTGFVKFNDTAQSWTNTSLAGATTANSGYWDNAASGWASAFGPKGYLIYVGGTRSESAPGLSSQGQLYDMSTITLYDVNSGQWYQQTATGDVPPNRNAFCYTSAATSGTFELFVYGGAVDQGTVDNQNPTDTGFLNVYVLSIPAFRWFKSSDSSPVRRANHYCSTIGNRQMISIGGSQPSDSGVQTGSTTGVLGKAQDPWPNGIGIFDMTAFKWSSTYNPNAAQYESPDIVKSYYSSSYTTPSFANPTLAAAFGASTSQNTSPTKTAGGNSGSTGSSTASSTSAPSSSGSSTNIGAIVGGVIGGVGVIILGVIAFLLFRRGRKNKTRVSSQPNDPRWMQGGYSQNAYGRPQDTKPYDSGYPDGGTYSSQGTSSYQSAPSEMALTQPPIEMSADPSHRGSSRFREMPG